MTEVKVIEAVNGEALQRAINLYLADPPADTTIAIGSVVGTMNGNIVCILTLTPETP